MRVGATERGGLPAIRWTGSFVLLLSLGACTGEQPDDTPPVDTGDSARDTGGDTAATAELAVTGELAFGTVSVGCAPVRTITLSNPGGADLTLTAIVASDPSLSVAHDTLPLTLAPGGSATVEVTWAPTDTTALDGSVTLTAEGLADHAVAATGAGQIEGEATTTWTVPEPPRVTAVFALHYYTATDARLFDALPAYFERLASLGVRYRAAFVTSEDGKVFGDVRYIDELRSPEDAVRAATGMLSRASGDNDYLLQTLSYALVENADWLFAEGWATSRLGLVGSNPDLEQSSGDAASYVSDFQATKADPALVTVSHIGGDHPRGCGSFAALSQAFYDAAEMTGGVYLSICDPDWTQHMVDLADNASGGSPFVLEGYPSEPSIRVQVDGSEGATWTLDTDSRAIVFDSYPPVGAEVRAEYVRATACE